MDRLLLLGAILVGAALLGLTYPIITAAAPHSQTAAVHSALPAYRYEAWYPLPVQEGRTKPLQSACVEAVRQITGRTTFEGHDPVGVVLAWVLTGGAGAGPGFTDWETYPFLLCEHRGLRQVIFEHRGAGWEEAGRYVSPADLRGSPGFDRLVDRASQARKDFGVKAHFHLTEEELRAEETARRLTLYDALCGRASTRLHRNALMGENFVELSRLAAVENTTADEALRRLERRSRRHPDPLRLAALDRAAGAAWFSRGELLMLREEPARWQEMLLVRQRQAEAPELYFNAECREHFREFQDRIGKGEGEQLLAELATVLEERRQDRLRRFERAARQGAMDQARMLFTQVVRTPQDQARLRPVWERAGQEGGGSLWEELVRQMRGVAQETDERELRQLREGLGSYRPDDPESRLLVLECLEIRFPELYRASATQPFPAQEVSAVLAAFANVQEAYRSQDQRQFDAASEVFFGVLRQTAEGPYPGVKTIGLEILLGRVQPFRWAWVLMLAAALAFLVSLSWNSRIPYIVGFGLALASLGTQAVGFAGRITISGWAPVSNMYETVIFASFMAGMFALVLESIYRRRVFGLAGAGVATLGLILADGLPLALDPKISQMVPVLRTNYWLTIHVLTIVCGYGAGALAWGLGNLSLALLAFGKGREGLATLAKLTYRSMQLTVLLLAAGTFLGGWWAAQAWGRFWGWDPKEVGALVALVCYVVPLHARYVGWVKEYGLAVWAVLCFGAILTSWYVLNFVLTAGLHSYGFGPGGGPWVLWAVVANVEWVLVATLLYRARSQTAVPNLP
jgi:ABC-type transport system involved in cytochrome c biogenesis permease subunit